MRCRTDSLVARKSLRARSVSSIWTRLGCWAAACASSCCLQAVAQEQTGRVTNALGWRFSNVQKWMVKACSPYQIETWVKPLIARCLARMLRHHRGRGRLRRRRHPSDGACVTVRIGVLDGESSASSLPATWPMSSSSRPSSPTGRTRRALPVLRRPSASPGIEMAHARPPIPTPSAAHHLIYPLQGCARSGSELHRRSKGTAWASPTTGSAMSG